ncbi:cell cycle and apoptosis regulator protein 2 [Rhinatrema bivittatum]|uniref:cell cycle and apoptosis regulator protein 2-like n=1 Tax=Rhinatrema bivittatum TaxID=194408 RepID=UPI00112BA267|nr:cell cycle and apoptosis regulator protein 2-like [Rhinatrema bivittatum]XP_029442425.1 cell cycle and apoptosis regulator protein 2-like [Rhinatrema bivittatum]XP_029442426.1 cell cycle and apoptosis regulator protein 2-like [Rhinatrema bivittatum]XP_029459642.1 cell cycle and apoptosis regulator protein 2 [Rhinatrema bivittatum]XP_029459643.1 cell cycle and apoptosis regulator protein 2 [Rhinatrema bivittatum]XP_029459645.1 cell cycle and apoptosis regulator protein 2 [Rhinatrema bivittat
MSQFKRHNRRRSSQGQVMRTLIGNPTASLLGPPPAYISPTLPSELPQSMLHLQMEEKHRVFTGIVTKLQDYFGVVDEEVFFQLSVVKGRVPQVGEKVLVKAVYNPNQSVPWNAVKVQALASQPLLKSPTPSLLHMAPLGQKQGILGAKPQLLFQPHRIPPLFPQKPVSLFPTISHTSLLGHHGRFSNQRGSGRRDDSQRGTDYDSKKRKQKVVGQQGAVKKPRHERPLYKVSIARHALTSSYCDPIEILRRYRNIQIPKDFFDVRLCYLDTFPLSQPLTLKYPCRIQISEAEEAGPEAGDAGVAELSPQDADPAFSAKVLLVSAPGLEEFYRNCLLYIEDPDGWNENLEHPSKQIKFLLGRKGEEAVAIGGEWSSSLDGADPERDPLVLIRTAIRCTKALTGIDLSRCTNWYRFADFRYVCPGTSQRVTKAAVFLPDLWSCMPSLVEWEALCQQKAGSKEAESPPSASSPSLKEEEAEKHEVENPEEENVTAIGYPSIFARPRQGFSCTLMSLWAMLEYRKQKERLSFEVSVLVEFFQEMLQRDFGYKIYKGLLSLPEVQEATAEGKKPEVEKEEELQEHVKSEEELETVESMESSVLKTDNGNVASKKEAPPRERVTTTDSADELCMLSLDDDVLHLEEEEEQDGFGCKLEDAELKSNASNQSEMEISSHHEMEKDSSPTAVLPLEALLGFVYFDQNFCGYIQRRDLEKLFLTLGLHLSTEQVKILVNKVVPRYVCYYRTLQFNQENLDVNSSEHIPEDGLCGNLSLLPPTSGPAVPAVQQAPAEQQDLLPYNGTLINVRNLLEKTEQTENGRLQLENKIHSLENKLVEAQLRVSTVEATNKTMTSDFQDMQKQVAEMAQQVKAAEKQKSYFQRQLQENSKRLSPLQQEIQKIIEKTNSCLEQKEQGSSN